MRIGFAGDRAIAVKVLKFIMEGEIEPSLLLVSGSDRASHADGLKSMCSFIPDEYVFEGSEFKEKYAIEVIQQLDLDLIVSIHFPYIYPKEIINLVRIGIINLHPAYLPYNRGWHTPSWAILDGTPAGATIHFIDEEVDKGTVIARRKVDVLPEDTAHSLYGRILKEELHLFKETWPQIVKGEIEPDDVVEQGTSHNKNDLFDPSVQRIDLDKTYKAQNLIDKLRALTTNRLNEAAYFEQDGKRYRIQVTITPED